MKTCYFCNTKMDDNVAKCPSCGAHLPVAQQPPAEAAPAAPQAPVSPAAPPAYSPPPQPQPYGYAGGTGQFPAAQQPYYGVPPYAPPAAQAPKKPGGTALVASLVGLGVSLLALAGVVIAILAK